MKIERKIAIGYTIIVALIGGIVYTYLHEWRQMNRLEREVKEIHRLRQSVHEAYVHMLDLTMFGETILEWERADTTLIVPNASKWIASFVSSRITIPVNG